MAGFGRIRDQRAFRCGFTHVHRGRKLKNAAAFASVSGTAADVALRFTLPLAEPPTEAVCYFSP